MFITMCTRDLIIIIVIIIIIIIIMIIIIIPVIITMFSRHILALKINYNVFTKFRKLQKNHWDWVYKMIKNIKPARLIYI